MGHHCEEFRLRLTRGLRLCARGALALELPLPLRSTLSVRDIAERDEKGRSPSPLDVHDAKLRRNHPVTGMHDFHFGGLTNDDGESELAPDELISIATEQLLGSGVRETNDARRIDDDNAVSQSLDDRPQTTLLRPAISPAICVGPLPVHWRWWIILAVSGLSLFRRRSAAAPDSVYKVRASIVRVRSPADRRRVQAGS